MSRPRDSRRNGPDLRCCVSRPPAPNPETLPREAPRDPPRRYRYHRRLPRWPGPGRRPGLRRRLRRRPLPPLPRLLGHRPAAVLARLHPPLPPLRRPRPAAAMGPPRLQPPAPHPPPRHPPADQAGQRRLTRSPTPERTPDVHRCQHLRLPPGRPGRADGHRRTPLASRQAGRPMVVRRPPTRPPHHRCHVPARRPPARPRLVATPEMGVLARLATRHRPLGAHRAGRDRLAVADRHNGGGGTCRRGHGRRRRDAPAARAPAHPAGPRPGAQHRPAASGPSRPAATGQPRPATSRAGATMTDTRAALTAAFLLGAAVGAARKGLKTLKTMLRREAGTLATATAVVGLLVIGLVILVTR